MFGGTMLGVISQAGGMVNADEQEK